MPDAESLQYQLQLQKCGCWQIKHILAVLCLGLGCDGFLARRNHLQLNALQDISLLKPCKTLQQHTALRALANTVHIQLVALDVCTRALMDLRSQSMHW